MKKKIIIFTVLFQIAIIELFAAQNMNLFIYDNSELSAYSFKNQDKVNASPMLKQKIIYIDETNPFELNPALDIPLSVTASAIAISAGIANLGEKKWGWSFKDNCLENSELSKSDIILMDQIFMNDYNKALSAASTVTEAMLLASPSIILPAMYAKENTFSWNEVAVDGTMYVQTMLTAWGIKEWIKLLVNRPRPYMYYDNYPVSKVEDGDWNDSFPSGHTTLSFAAASFLTYTFFQYYPESPGRFWILGASYGLATTTAFLRMASGNHFATDVMTGALIGTVCGIAIPFMHTQLFYSKFKKNQNNDFSFNISPACIALSFRF